MHSFVIQFKYSFFYSCPVGTFILVGTFIEFERSFRNKFYSDRYVYSALESSSANDSVETPVKLPVTSLQYERMYTHSRSQVLTKNKPKLAVL